MQAKTGPVMAGRHSSLGSMSMGGQRGAVLRQAFRGTPLVGNNRAIRIGGVRTHAINIRAEKVRVRQQPGQPGMWQHRGAKAVAMILDASSNALYAHAMVALWDDVASKSRVWRFHRPSDRPLPV